MDLTSHTSKEINKKPSFQKQHEPDGKDGNVVDVCGGEWGKGVIADMTLPFPTRYEVTQSDITLEMQM